MTVQELIDALLAIEDKTLPVWLTDNDCCEVLAGRAVVEDRGGDPICFIGHPLQKKLTPEEKRYINDSEKYNLEYLQQELADKFMHEAITPRLLAAIEQYVFRYAMDHGLWRCSRFMVHVVSDPVTDQPKINLRPVPMTAAAFQDILGIEPKDDDVERINCGCSGGIGHFQCGWCDDHWRQRSICGCMKTGVDHANPPRKRTASVPTAASLFDRDDAEPDKEAK